MPRNSFSVRATGAVTAPLAQLTVGSAGLELMVRRLVGSNKTTTIPAAAICSVSPIVDGAWTAVEYRTRFRGRSRRSVSEPSHGAPVCTESARRSTMLILRGAQHPRANWMTVPLPRPPLAKRAGVPVDVGALGFAHRFLTSRSQLLRHGVPMIRSGTTKRTMGGVR